MNRGLCGRGLRTRCSRGSGVHWRDWLGRCNCGPDYGSNRRLGQRRCNSCRLLPFRRSSRNFARRPKYRHRNPRCRMSQRRWLGLRSCRCGWLGHCYRLCRNRLGWRVRHIDLPLCRLSGDRNLLDLSSNCEKRGKPSIVRYARARQIRLQIPSSTVLTQGEYLSLNCCCSFLGM